MGVRSRSVQRLLARQVLIPNTPWRLVAYCAFHLSSAVLFIYLFVIFVIYDCCTTLDVSSNQLWLFIVLSFGIYCPFETCESLSVYLSTLISTRDHKKLLFPQLIQFICGRFHLSASLISFCVRFTDDSKALISIQTRRPRLTKHLINVVKTHRVQTERFALHTTRISEECYRCHSSEVSSIPSLKLPLCRWWMDRWYKLRKHSVSVAVTGHRLFM